MLTARVSLAKKCGGVVPEGIAFLYLLDAWSGEMDRRGLAAFTRSAYGRAAREYLQVLEASGIMPLEAADRASVFGYLASFRGGWARINGNAYVLSDQGKAGFIRSQPYLLPQTETKLFFRSAALLDVSSSCKWQAVAFFALMHSCGLRTGKVRPLTPANVGFDDGFIDVLASKGNRDRLLPLTREILDILTDCNTQSRRVIAGDRATFLVSSTGKPVTPAAVGGDLQPYLGPGRTEATQREETAVGRRSLVDRQRRHAAESGIKTAAIEPARFTVQLFHIRLRPTVAMTNHAVLATDSAVVIPYCVSASVA